MVERLGEAEQDVLALFRPGKVEDGPAPYHHFAVLEELGEHGLE